MPLVIHQYMPWTGRYYNSCTANIPAGWAGFGNEIINPFSQIRDTYNLFGSSIEGNFNWNMKFDGLTATSRIGFKTTAIKQKLFTIVNYGAGKVFNTDRSTVSQNKTTIQFYIGIVFKLQKSS